MYGIIFVKVIKNFFAGFLTLVIKISDSGGHCYIAVKHRYGKIKRKHAYL
jgi:hypothetical protein